MSRIRLGGAGGLRIGAGGTAQVRKSFEQPATTTAALSLTNGRWILSINGLSVGVQQALSGNRRATNRLYLRFRAYNPSSRKVAASKFIYHSQARGGSIPARMDLTQYVRTGRLQSIDITDFMNDMLYANRLRGLATTNTGININIYGSEVPGKTSNGTYYSDFSLALTAENESGRNFSEITRTQTIRAVYTNALSKYNLPVSPTSIVNGVVTI